MYLVTITKFIHVIALDKINLVRVYFLTKWCNILEKSNKSHKFQKIKNSWRNFSKKWLVGKHLIRSIRWYYDQVDYSWYTPIKYSIRVISETSAENYFSSYLQRENHFASFEKKFFRLKIEQVIRIWGFKNKSKKNLNFFDHLIGSFNFDL